MSIDPNNVSKLAFSTRCLPGSEAEKKEQERLAAFQQNKARRQAEEELQKPELDAARHREYLAACEANDARARRQKAERSARNGFTRP